MDSRDPEVVDVGAARLQDLFLRAVGALYAVGFLIAARQAVPLFGHDGLLPWDLFEEKVVAAQGSWTRAFDRIPGIFWQWSSDSAMEGAAWLGLAAALLVMAGVQHLSLFALMWMLYLSFYHAGQIWYGFGWETLLLETGFLCLFVAPATGLRPRPQVPGLASAASRMRWLASWLLFRLMFGAGMIKIRGDECWRDLTCLYYHYETQPNPHPLSRFFHTLPHPLLQAGVAFNHFVELLVPFALFLPPLRNLAVGITVLFQLTLIASGNLAFLNWLTIAVALGCLEPGRWPFRKDHRPLAGGSPGRALLRSLGTWGYVALVAYKSMDPVSNLLSPDQAMNTSYDPLHLVNSYGAFGSVGRERMELSIEGSDDRLTWKEYAFPCKPGPLDRRPCLITPYHLRLDWELWFAAMGNLQRYNFLINLAYKLLHNDPMATRLLAENPFPERPPRYLRIDRYRYHFASDGNWWRREKVDAYLRPVSGEDPDLLRVVRQQEWEDRLSEGSHPPNSGTSLPRP